MNSIFNNKDFLRPLVTPYELEMALVPQQVKGAWDGGYDLDFQNLLRDTSVDEWAQGCVAQQAAASQAKEREAKAMVTVGGKEGGDDGGEGSRAAQKQLNPPFS